MKILADECCEVALVKALREEGDDVLYIPEILRGANDDDVLS